MSNRNHRRANHSTSSLNRRRILTRAVEPMLLVEPLERRVLLTAPLVWTPTGIGDGGSSFYPEVNPLNTQEMYLGSDVGEEAHMTNYNWTGTPSTSTGTWTILDSSQLQGAAIESGTQFTNNPQIQYALSGGTLKKTTDDGKVWTDLTAFSGPGLHLLVDPNSANNLVVDSDTGEDSYDWAFYYTSNGGQSFNEISVGGVNVSGTNDPVQTWFAGAFWDDTGSGATNTLYFATNKGLYEATGLNSGSAWTWTQPAAFDNLAGGVVGTAVVNGSDQVTSVTLSNDGHGYTTAPNVSFSGGGGSGAAGTAVLNGSGQVTSVTITAMGSGYTSAPTVSFSYETYYSFTGSRSGTNTQLWATTWSSGGYFGTGTGQPAQLGVNFASFFMHLYTASAGATGWTSAETGSTLYNYGTNTTNFGTGPSTAGIFPRYVQMIDGNINDVWFAGGKLNSGDTNGGPVVYGSTNGGVTWTSLFQTAAQSGGTLNANIYTHWLGDGSTDGFGYGYGGDPTPLLVDRSSSGTNVIITFGVAGDAFRSDNDGTTWVSITGSPADLNAPGTSVSTNTLGYASTYDESVTNYMAFPTPDVIINGAADGLNEVSTNGGVSWTFPNTGSLFGINEMYEPTYDPNNGLMYVVTSNIHMMYTYDYDSTAINAQQGVSGDYLLMSPDDGVTWTEVHGFNAPPRTITLDPDNVNIMYVGTADYAYGGFWETTDLQDGANSVWTRLGDGVGVNATAVMDVGNPSITNPGAGYTSAPTVTLTGGLGTGSGTVAATITAAIATSGADMGQVTSLTITNAGSGYVSVPTLSFSGGGDTTSAAAKVTLVVGSFNLANGGAGYTQSAMQVFFSGYTNNASASVTVGAGGTITSMSVPSGDGGSYSSVPGLYITSATDEPLRGAGFNGLDGTAGTFDAQHPLDMYIITDDDGQMVAVAAMAISSIDGSLGEYSGVWTATSTNEGLTWSAWNDVTALDSVGGGGYPMSKDLASVVMDPNNPDVLYATVDIPNTEPSGEAGYLFKGILSPSATNVTWTAWATPAGNNTNNEGWGIYLVPGTNEMYVGVGAGLFYTANDYGASTTNTATFIQLTNVPLGGEVGLFGNPWVPGQIWITNSGGGVYVADTNSLGGVNPPTNLTAQALNGTQVELSWKTSAPYPNSYLIQDEANGATTWSNVATVPSGYDSSYLVTGLTAGTQYVFQVTSVEGLAAGTALTVNMSIGGFGYTSAPTVTINNANTGGSNFAGTAIVENGAVTGFTVTNAGTGYTSAPTVTFSNGGGAGAFGTVAISDSVPSIASNAVRTDSTAALIASEGFGESTGNLNGASSGSGWSGSWSAVTGWNIVSGNLTPATIPNGQVGAGDTVTLPNSTGGNHVTIPYTGSSNATRTLSTTVGTTGTVLWASVEEAQTNSGTGGLLIGNTTNGILFGASGNTPDVIVYESGTSYQYSDTAKDNEGGQANFYVARMDFESTGMTIQFYVDPMPGLDYPTNAVIFNPGWNGQTLPNGQPLPSPFGTTGTTTVSLVGSASENSYDEIYLGTTYDKVAPYTGGITAPNSPTGMVATIASANEIDLTWTDNATAPQSPGEADGYILEEKKGSSSYAVIDTIPSSGVSSYQVTNLSPNTSYTFEVEAYNSAGNSSSFATSSAATTANNSVPTGVVSGVGVSVANGTFNVTWSNTVSGATGYYVEYSNDFPSPFDTNLVQWTTSVALGNVSGYSISGLATNIPYYFRVIPYNANGTGIGTLGVPLDYVSQVNFGSPTVTSAQAVSTTTAGNASVAVNWTDSVPGISTFAFQYNTTGGTTWTSGGSVAETSVAGETPFQYVITGLSADTQYYFEVQAQATGSSGVWSAPITARTFSNSALIAYDGFDYPYVPGSTTDLSGQSGGIGWSGGWSASAGDYYVASGSVADTNSTVASDLLTTGNNFAGGLGNNATRTLASALSTSSGSSVWISVLEHYDNSTNTPAGYVDLYTSSGSDIEFGLPTASPSAFSIHTTGSVQDGYNTGVAPTAGDTYWLVFEITYGATNTLNLWVDPNPTSSSPSSSISTSGTYTVTSPITAIGIDGEGDGGDLNNWDELRVGASYAAVAPLVVPQTPVQSAATNQSGSVLLNWTEASNPTGVLTGFNIWRSTNAQNWTNIASTSASATSYTDSSGTVGTLYYYAITAYNSTGDSVYSNIEYAQSNAAGLIAYDGFNYPYVSGSTTDLQGQSGGIGWSGGWSASGGDYDIASGSIVDTNSTVASDLLTTGNSFSSGLGNVATRTLSSALSTSSGSHVWVSVLEQYDNTTNTPFGYVNLIGGASGNNIYFGLTPTFPNDFSIHTTGSVQDSYNTGVAPTKGDAYWMVFEITYGATDTISLWVDPNPTSSSPSSSTSISGNWTISTAPQITAVQILGAGNGGDINTWDELRVGSTYAGVAPLILPRTPVQSAVTDQSSSLLLNWTEGTNPTGILAGYNVWRSTDQVNWVNVGTTNATTSSFTDSSVLVGTTYYYAITAYNSSGNTVYSNIESGVAGTPHGDAIRGKAAGAAPLISNVVAAPASSTDAAVVSTPAAQPFAATSTPISTSDGSSPVSASPLTAVAVQNNNSGSPFLAASSLGNADEEDDSGDMVDSLMADNSGDLLLSGKSSQSTGVFSR